MREILFRGKRIDNGEWAEGYLGVFKDTTQVFVPYTKDEEERYKGSRLLSAIGGLWYVVDPETVGQYTGLTDKNGTKIFEGDIVKDDASPTRRLLGDRRKIERSCVGTIKFGLHEVPSDDPFCWGDAYGFYIDGDTLYPTFAQFEPICEDALYAIEVVGNIHDNPELLES